jgi:hypothetical protein
MRDIILTLIGWLPDSIEPFAEVLIFLGLLSVLSLAPLVLWLAWAARGRRSDAA